MPITRDEIIPTIDFVKAERKKHIATRYDHGHHLAIHNYTKDAMWDNEWNVATVNCRGLVTDTRDLTVVARPFRKFFNYGQPGAPEIPLQDPVIVTDKADGSLGILVPVGGGDHVVATRGSFFSEQAVWATEHWQKTYAGKFFPNPDWTYLFEIVYPENRIVLDYAGMEDLILLGAVHTATGRSVDPFIAAQGWPGPMVRVLPHKTLEEALSAPPRPNAEGLVVWHPATDERVKIKQEDYLRLHKMFTGTTKKSVWEILAAGGDPLEALGEAPDEFHQWITETADELRSAALDLATDVALAYLYTIWSLPEDFERKTFALAVKDNPLRKYLFIMLDGGDIMPLVWVAVRPEHEVLRISRSEDVA